MSCLPVFLYLPSINFFFVQVGPQCMLGEGSQMGDKCSVKKSVIGRHCRIGSNVKVFDKLW